MSSFITGFGEAWSLAKPYFRSEERWAAYTLLAAVIGLNLLLVGLGWLAFSGVREHAADGR